MKRASKKRTKRSGKAATPRKRAAKKAKAGRPLRKKAAPRKTVRKPALKPATRKRRGLMFVLSSPSGAGKTTLTRMLLEDEKKNVELSVSVTTREKRASEIEGRHYFFIDRARFDQLVERGELLEWAEVHGNGYGTPKKPVEKHLRAGRDVIFDIDWQGTLQLYGAARKDVVSVFVLPPNAHELRTRLARRAEDNQEVIDRRLRNAIEELEHWREYDYIVINDDLDRAYRAVKTILDGERGARVPKPSAAARDALREAAAFRRDAQPQIAALVKRIQSEL